MFKKYFTYWLMVSSVSVQSVLSGGFTTLWFIAAKLIRFWTLWIVLTRSVNNSPNQAELVAVTYLVATLMDSLGQLFFRGIYWFRDQIVRGDLDFRLVKPINPLFAVMTRSTDIMDIPVTVIVIAMLIPYIINAGLLAGIGFGMWLVAGFLVMTAFHIVVAALGILTAEVDHTIMIYRDLTAMARVPLQYYSFPIRFMLIYIIPVAVAFSFPTLAVTKDLTWWTGGIALVCGLGAVGLTYQFWLYALRYYSSASS